MEGTKGAPAAVVVVVADAEVAMAMLSVIPARRPPVAVQHHKVAAPIKVVDRSRDAVPAIAAATIRAETALAAGRLSSPNSKAVVRAASVAA